MTRAKAQAAIFWLITGGLAGGALGGLLLGLGISDGDPLLLVLGYAVSGIASVALLIGAVGKGVEVGVVAATPDDY